MRDKKLTSYEEAFNFLLEFTDYEKVTKYKYDIATFNLDRVEELMAAMGSPHRAFRSVHIAGTKGKGSTAMMMQSILSAAGMRTGLFTSPHLCRLEERMTIDGEMMPERELIDIVNQLVPYASRARAERPNESPTYFELITAAGFLHFAHRKVDFAVIEVGLGGRLDATNVIRPEVTAITRVDFDHVERLGGTLGRIAYEKAGIIKENVPVVCAPQEPEALRTITAVAQQRSAPLTLLGRDYKLNGIETDIGQEGAFCRFNLTGSRHCCKGLTVRLLGAHQAVNAATAIAVADILQERCGLNLDEEKMRRGLESARCPARLEFFSGKPPILLDCAHNAVSVRGLCEVLDTVLQGRPPVFVLGFSRDKDIRAMLDLLLPRARAVVFTRSDSPRAAKPEHLADLAREVSGTEAEVFDDPNHALARARDLAAPDDLICISGSFFLAGNLRPALVARPADADK